MNHYLCDYWHSVEEIEKLVTGLHTVAFPDAAERPTVGTERFPESDLITERD